MERVLTAAQRSWLSGALGGGPRVTDSGWTASRLVGGTSTTLLALRDARGAPSYALRFLDNGTWLGSEPDLLAHEVAALREARNAGLRVPEIVAVEPSGTVFGAPALLSTFLPGRVVLTPTVETRWVELLAGTLARLHAHQAPEFPWRYRSWVVDENVVVPRWSRRPEVWERGIAVLETLRSVCELAAPSWTTFLHRDYHPLNLLFSGEGEALEVSGVVDWVNACVGPPEADVAHCRLNLLLMRGRETADAFLNAYRAARGGFEYDRAWDVEAVFNMAMPTPTFYPPWREFGVATIEPSTLRERVEELLLAAL